MTQRAGFSEWKDPAFPYGFFLHLIVENAKLHLTMGFPEGKSHQRRKDKKNEQKF